MKPFNNSFSNRANRLFEFALPPFVIAIAVAYVMRAVGIGWEMTSGFMFIAFVIAFRINIRERRSPQ